jgi:hypothetical protein
VKVRQPLFKVLVPDVNAHTTRQIRDVADIIMAEVNVKEIAFLTEENAGMFVKKIKPNFKELGKRYGKLMKDIAAAITALDQAGIAAFERNNGMSLQVGGEQIALTLTDVEITSDDIPGWSIAKEAGITVALDLTLTDELRMEGIARDIVNRVQNLRKDMGLEVQDKINIKAQKGEKNATPFGKTLIFSLDGKTPLTPRVILYHFDEMLTRCEIDGGEERDLVPYSFRHYFITDMINKGASPTQVAETCGTSTAQIEKTYYHTTERKMIENAMPQFYYKDGLLIPK